MKRASKEQDNSEDARKREAFNVFDMDGNGYIDKHELKYVMRRLGENLSDEDLKAMFSEADLNGDGFIDYDGELWCGIITITRLCNILQFFTAVEMINIQMKNCDIFSYFSSKQSLRVLVRTASMRQFQRVPTIYVLEQN